MTFQLPKQTGIVDSINASPHKGIYGLLPKVCYFLTHHINWKIELFWNWISHSHAKDVDSEDGQFTLRLAKEKFAPKDLLLNEEDSNSFRKEFFSKKENKYFSKNRLVLADLNISNKLNKGYQMKRGLICRIKGG